MRATDLARMLVLTATLALVPTAGVVAQGQRQPVLSQVAHPHTYYWREMYMPQLTSGPSSASFSPDGKEVIYSMQGSLWRQSLGSDSATQLTAGPGYDYQPDWSPDGRRVVFTRQHGNALNLVLLNLDSGKETTLTEGQAVNLEPRWSPDGRRLAFVSSRADGYFGLYVAKVANDGLADILPLVAGEVTARDRYYYSQQDHAINPSWSPDGKTIYFVSNAGVAWGSGDIWSVEVDNPQQRQHILTEETTWSARPEMAHDGKRLLYASYEGRQWHQLWLTSAEGLSPLPLTFGEFDLRSARWSPDDRQLLYVSNETGNLTLWLHTVVGGARKQIIARNRIYKTPMVGLDIRLQDETGAPLAGRVIVSGGGDRHYGPDAVRMHADDHFDPATTSHENHYFHCYERCSVMAPQGAVRIQAASGFSHRTTEVSLTAGDDEREEVTLTLPRIGLDKRFGEHVSADLHVHMNYGGQYRQTLAGLARQAQAEGLDIIYNLVVNKEQRIPDIAEFKLAPDRIDGVTIYQAQEYHTSYWGHLSFLHLDDHYLTPDFASYRHTALASPYPSNSVANDLAHAQGAVTGYVHPFDQAPQPNSANRLSHGLPVDVVLGKTDFLEIVAFANHEQTASVWYRFLNLGYPLAAGAGTDAMTNYASLRGPVGLDRVYLRTDKTDPASLKQALKGGAGYVTNGPHLGLLAKREKISDAVAPGGRVAFPGTGGVLNLEIELASFAPVERLEVVQNGRVVSTIPLDQDGQSAKASVSIPVAESGWVLLRAANMTPHPFVQDIYTYATTNPVWIDVDGKPQTAPEDAQYFLDWLRRMREDVARRADDFNAQWEMEAVLTNISEAERRLKEKLNAQR